MDEMNLAELLAAIVDAGANLGDLPFSVALELAKDGHLIARSGWNGSDMFVYLVNGSDFVVNRPPLDCIYPEGTQISYSAHLDMKTADGKCVPWLASQTDLLASDWFVVKQPVVPFGE